MFDKDGRIILSPGPVHVSPESFRDLPLLHHRSDEFRKIVTETEGMLKEFLGTGSPVYLVTASGTGAMETAVANVAGADSRALVVSGGRFGDRWAELFRAYECPTDVMRFPDGASVDAASVLERIERTRPEIVAVTHVESSTGLLFPLRELMSGMPGRRPILIVDAISSFGVEELETDGWGIDVVVGASQKALFAPPGVGFISMSARARELAKKRARRIYYFDINRYETGRERGDAPFTPAIQTIQLVHRSLSRSRDAGFESVMARHRRASSAFLSAAKHLSLAVFPASPSSSVQVLLAPAPCGAMDLETQLARAGFIVAGGQGDLKGRVIRTGFLGVFGSDVLLRFVAELGRILEGRGCRVDLAAAQDAIEAETPQGYLF